MEEEQEEVEEQRETRRQEETWTYSPEPGNRWTLAWC